MKRRFWILPTVVAATALTPLISCGQTKINLEKVKSNYFDILINTTPTNFLWKVDGGEVEGDFKNVSAEDIKEQLIPVKRKGLLDKEYESFKFKDLIYDDPDRATWPAHIHIERMLHLAVAAYQQNDAAKMDIAVKLTIWWVQDDLWNPNWWFNTIGVPRDLSSVGMILMDKLPYAAQQRLLEIVHRGSYKYCPSTRTYTGANLFWYGDITLKCALLEKDDEAIKLMIKCVSDGIVENETEGFQRDGTFFQHSKIVYNGGYGRQAATLLTQIIASFAGSGYEWSQDKLEILTNYIVNGVGPTTHKGQFSFLTMGRALSRKNASNVNGFTTDLGNVFIFKYLTNLENCPHKQEINVLLDHLEKRDKANFEGIRCFPSSSMISMNVGNDVVISFKGTGDDLISSETANEENVLGHNLSFGVNTCVMETGEEYKDISPYWQYHAIPGVTSIPEGDELLSNYNDDDFKPVKDQGPFFCGETDGIAFSMQKSCQTFRDETYPSTLRHKLNYTVTCFATPQGMVLLGSGLQYEKSGVDITTHVEQCFLKNDKLQKLGNKVIHGNVVYKNILNDSDFVVNTPTIKKGNWRRNKRSYDDKIEPERDLLFIDLPTNANTYAYSIQPINHDDTTFIVACNTESIHAIDLKNGRLAIACYSPGTFQYEEQEYEIAKPGYSVIEKKA